MMKNIVIIFILFTALIFPKQDRECNTFLYDHNAAEIEKLMSTIKDAALSEGKIEVLHQYFEGDTSRQIIDKMNMISNCFQTSGDSLNQYLAKVYLSRFHYRIGDFELTKKEIDNVDEWAWDIKGTAIEDQEKFKEINQFISSIKSIFYDEIENNSTDFSTLTVRIAPAVTGSRRIPEGLLVNQNGEKISMEILSPKKLGDYIFDDPIKRKRFVHLKNTKKSITFDDDLGDGSFVMHINYLPLLPQGEEYTFLIKDISNGILQRYKAEFSQYNKDRSLDILFHKNWMIKLSAAGDKIKVWLPVSNEYMIRVEDKYGNQEQIALGNVQDKLNGNYYNIYRLESMQDKDSEYDYKFIYQELTVENTSFMTKWGRRLIIMSLSAGVIVYQMGN